MLYIYALTLLWNLGYTDFGMSRAMLPAMGLLFIFIGYMLRKAKRNFFIGIRTPWTLSSDKVWDETHRLGAILFMISGVLALHRRILRRHDRLLAALRADDWLDDLPGDLLLCAL